MLYETQMEAWRSSNLWGTKDSVQRIGVLGAGQLGRMLALAGYSLGLGFVFFDTVEDAPAGQMAELKVGSYTDPAALRDFAQSCDCITYEFENVPVEAAQFLQQFCPVFPPPKALEVAQDRVAEKTFMRDLGIGVPAFFAISSAQDLQEATEKAGFPCVLKTRRLGYDGKGQYVLKSEADISPAWQALGQSGLILEAFVAFERELSVVAVRSAVGEMAFYPLVQNHHMGGILRKSLAPAPNLSPQLQAQAEAIAVRVLEKLDYVGVLAIELFEQEGQLLVNEMAPRVHNSGHWSIEGAETGQFENHLRAILGLPLGSVAPRGHSVMLNLIGVRPDFESVLRIEGGHLHWYGKQVKPGRKVGHITLRSEDLGLLVQRVSELEPLLDIKY